nr:TRAP transporter large permease subunit [Oceanococcus sp. HetDA_MAG_MS8]
MSPVGFLLLAAALAGLPLFVVIGASAALGYHSAGIDSQALIIEFQRLAQMPVLQAIPLFTAAGYILGESQAPQRLVRLTQAFLGWLPGGLAVVCIAACAFFTALTGASGVTIIALGALLYPALRSADYPSGYGLGLLTSAGSLGLLFAPSLPLILYGVVAQQLQVGPAFSIQDLFLAGVIPGLLMVLVLGLHAMWVCRNHPRPQFVRSEAWAALWASRWDLPLPLLLVGGIYSGAIAVSEAACLALFWVLLTEVVILRELRWHRLPAVLAESMQLVGGILLILGMSLASTNVLIDAGVPEQLFRWVQQRVDSPWTFLLLLNVFLLLLGMLLDIFSAIVLMVPLLLPMAVAYDIHPVHLGIVFLANLQLGYFTPPVGMNLFIAAWRFNEPVLTVVRASLPFFALLALCVLLLTWWPQLSLILL